MLGASDKGQLGPVPGLPNFTIVEGTLYRGGQPDDAGWNELKRLGVTTVVKLDPAGEAQDVAAEALGMKVVYEPIGTLAQLATMPGMDQVQRAVNALGGLDTYVHCKHGQDRTGLVVGCYRVWTQGWSKEAAWQEMLEHGYHRLLLGLTLFWKLRV